MVGVVENGWFRRSSLGLFTATALLAIVAACGGGSKVTTPPATASSADAGAKDAAVQATPPPSGLPPMAVMPPPGVVGSKKGKTKRDPSLLTCSGAIPGSGKDPGEAVKKLGEACASATKMRPTGSPMRGQQADKDPHQEQKFRVDAGKCYRVYFATGDGVQDATIVLRDSAGDVVAESAGVALPEDGTMCFTSSDEVTLLVGMGAGKGPWAAQVWSD